VDGTSTATVPSQNVEALDATQVLYKNGIRLVPAAQVDSAIDGRVIFDSLKSILNNDDHAAIEAICQHAAPYTWVVLFNREGIVEKLADSEIRLNSVNYAIQDASSQFEKSKFTRNVSQGQKYSHNTGAKKK
jgi:hypothetical protein